MEKKSKARLIAYYLPQFHPIPENDEWWGKGFTEWVNVAKAKPLFRGHYQPHIPADLGFYDLRLSETRTAQAKIAEEHGIEGFCYWHYWFAGKRLLERPFNEVLKAKEPKFPFCLGWANESWTGIWHGCADRMLIEQTYAGIQDEEAHFNAVLEAFFDNRYITVEGKPVFYIYKPHNLPDSKGFIERWNNWAIKAGLKGIHFIGENDTSEWNPQDDGFDALVENIGVTFQRMIMYHSLPVKLFNIIRYYNINVRLNRPIIFSYKAFINCALNNLNNDFLQYPCVLPNWDTTPRCNGRGYVLTDSTPELFRIYLRRAIDQVSQRAFDKRLIFIKSWNEWAEGNHLEPDKQFGRGYLEVCRDENNNNEK